MKKYNYRYYSAPNKIIAVSSFAGKPVRGVAKCAPGDEFDIEKGKELAAARCSLKVAEKRKIRATEKYIEASAAVVEAQQKLAHMRDYFIDASDRLDEAEDKLNELLESL